MSKPIKLTEQVIQEMQAEFMAALTKAKMSDGKITYTRQFAYKEDAHAQLVFTPAAFAKMAALVREFTVEIAWHACTTRDPEDKTKFYIDDILVYPQEITSTTVDMDEMKYAMWLMENDGDERFDRIHFQGHSHVNMAVSPSGTDTAHQEEILRQLPADSYYIFLIMNKRFEYNLRVFDLENNILYENNEVDVIIGEPGLDLDAFVEAAREIAPRKTAAVTTVPPKPAQTPAKNTQQPYRWGQNSARSYDDYYDDYYNALYGYGSYGRK